MFNKTKIQNFLILLFPLLLFYLNLQNMLKMPFASIETVDPEYIHLISSIHLAELHPKISSIESPGTILYVFGAIITKSVFLISSNSDSLTTDFIQNPEKYIFSLRIVLIILSSFSILFLGYVLQKKTKQIYLTLLLQLTPFLSTDILYSCTIIAPENLLITLMPLFISTIVCFLYNKNIINENKYVLLFSLIVAVGIATKVTFLPLFFLPLFILKFKSSVKYVFLTFVFTLLLAFTATIQYQQFYEWIKNLIIHSGRYGSGEENFLNISDFLNNLKIIFANEFIFAAIFLFLVAKSILYFIFKKEKSILNKLMIGLSIVIALQLFITAKHFSIRYLTPSLMFTGFILFIILKTMFKQEIIFKNQKFNLSITAFIIVFFITSFNKITSVADDKDGHRKSRLVVKKFMEKNNTIPILIVPNYFGSSAKEYALHFSSIWSGIYKENFINKLYKIYPNRYFYFHAQNKYYDWMNETSLFDILINHSVLNVYVSLDATNKTEIEFEKEIKSKINIYNNSKNSVIRLVTLLKTRFDWIFKLQIDTAKLSNYFQYEHLVCDMEKISEENMYYVSEKDSFFINNKNRTKCSSISGNFAEKIDKQNPWGICCTLDSIKNGNYYEASVWVKNDDEKCYIVGSTEDYKTLYISSNSIVEKKRGWKKIKVSFIADEKTINSRVKFFVWYQGENLSLVDDFKIKIGKR